jgi:tripartite-type tricarboxylate transporter receptor subunit TctC
MRNEREGKMKLPCRRQFLHLVAGAALPAVSRIAWAQAYPSRPVRIIVGQAAGSGPDLFARLLARRLSDRLGQQFAVENRPSANIAAEMVVRAPPDGYTLLMANGTNAINATLYPNLNFNFIRDIAPVAIIGRTPVVLAVNPSLPAKTLPDFIAYAKANPGKIKFASSGNGSPLHLAGQLFETMAGVELVHAPYRNSYMPDLLGGQVQVAFTTIPSLIEYIRAGKLRALAVAGATRSDTLPGVPTVGEFVPGYEASAWYGLGAPKGTPTEIIEKLNKTSSAALADPDTKSRLVSLGVEPMSMTPAEFGKLMFEETEKWGKVIRAANITPE